MADHYRIFGAELSPYSVKVRSYCRYKGIPHEWIIRTAATQAEYEKYAKIPIIPLVVTPEDKGIQDSTPIIEQLESLYPDPSIHPSDPVTFFISALLEEFGDEWGNKWMFHYRWAREVDQISSAGRIARMMMPQADEKQHAQMVSQVQERMVNRVWFVGSNEQTASPDRGIFSRRTGAAGSPPSATAPTCLEPVLHLVTWGYGAKCIMRGPILHRVRLLRGGRPKSWPGYTACCGREPRVTSSHGRALNRR